MSERPPRSRVPARSGRRQFLTHSAAGASAALIGPSLLAAGCGDSEPIPAFVPQSGDLTRHGALGPANADGVRVPEGFTARVIARSRESVVDGSDYAWHIAPDGAATFPTRGGYIYVSNSELVLPNRAGVGAIRFSHRGEILDAYPILEGSWWNCSGGATPWGTWLSGEEHEEGLVWECDPEGVEEARALPALGLFAHEAVAVDPGRMRLYLTEDEPDGRLYRFTPDDAGPGERPSLDSGTLEVLRVMSGEVGAVAWEVVPDPSGASTPTRLQVPSSTAFAGGEGIWYHADEVFFTTKGDDRIWALDVSTDSLRIVYDSALEADPILTGVDFILATSGGDLLVAEDGGDMQVVAISPDGAVVPLVQIEGHDGSEVTGLAFDPTLRRLYFSSQRGVVGTGMGVTYEMVGPFFER